MKYLPRRHQQIADGFLRKRDRAGLFLGMGLGKSAVTLTLLDEYIHDTFRVNKALVVAPLKVAEDTWSREAEKWDHLRDLRVVRVLGTEKRRMKALETDADVYVINRENVVWLVEKLGKRWPFDALIIDELSSFKSTKAKRWRMLKRIAPLCKIVWGLTGTPAGKGYMDLFAEIYLLDGGKRLGSTLTAYRDRYFTPGAHKGHIVYEWRLKPGAKEAIDQALSDLCLSMKTEDWIDLPDEIFMDHVVHMAPKEQKLYDQFKKEKILPLLDGKLTPSIEDADHAVLGSTAATVSGKLLQMANGAVYDDSGNVFHIHDQKLDVLEEILEGLDGENVLLFYNYQHDRDQILERFKQAKVMDGSEDIAAWNAGKIPLLLCHPASVAYGLNMQEGGHHIVWFGVPWSLELYQQANARLHRQGQQHTVFIHHILTAGTLDQRVVEALAGKDAVQDSLLRALAGYLEET